MAPSSSPDKIEADAFEDEIEITPEMIEAGADIFLRYSGGAEILIGSEETAVIAIFTAMVRAMPPDA